MLKKMIFALCATVILAAQVQATLIYFTQLGLQEGNKGQFLIAGDISVSALTHITATGSNAGTIYLDDHYGLGVQTLSGCGSTGISGSSSDQDEALIFDFATGALASSLQVGLSRYSSYGDEPLITAVLSGGSELSFSEDSTNWDDAVNYLGSGRIAVNLGLLLGGAGIGQDETVSRLYVRETGDHIYVKSLGYEPYTPEPVPEPATIGLLGFGGLALLCKPRERKRM